MKVTTKKFRHLGDEDINFDYVVNVSKTGLFYTTLPLDAVAKIEAYGLTMPVSNRGNRGYFEGQTLDQLEDTIRALVDEALSCELVSTKDVIEYQVSIGANYCKNTLDPDNNRLFPNGSGLNGQFKWITGTNNNSEISLSIYAKPRTYKLFRYKSGKEKIVDSAIDETIYPHDSAILFLNSLVNVPNKWQRIQTTTCNETNANFFKSAIMAIWQLNEELAQVLKDDTLEDFLHNTPTTVHLIIGHGNN